MNKFLTLSTGSLALSLLWSCTPLPQENPQDPRFGWQGTTIIEEQTVQLPPRPTPTPAPAYAESPAPAATPAPTPTPAPEIRNYPYGVPVPDKPGFVTSPHSPYSGYVDVRGFPSGTEVKDPFTGKIFLVP